MLASQTMEEELEPSIDWLHNFVERHELRVVDGQEMERVRALACDKSRIREYFLKWIPSFNRDPRLIFGADETDVKPTFRMKVVTNKKQQGHVAEESINHLTAMCCHSAAGAALPPFFILQDLKNLPRELNEPHLSGPDQAWYCSTKKGWMTEGSLYSWFVMFVSWISQYRVRVLPPNLELSEILLIMDGHTSRNCPWIIPLCAFHNIAVMILPAHTTHLLQAFDVVLASPLKCHFRRFLASEKEALGGRRSTLNQTAWSRLVTISAFIRAWRAVTSGSLCARSFEKVGIFPLNPDRVLCSPFVVETATPSLGEKTIINNELLTTPAMFHELCAQKDSRGQLIVPPQPDFGAIQTNQWPAHMPLVTWMMQQDIAWGRLLSWPLDMFWYIGGTWQRVEMFKPRENSIQPTQSLVNMMQRLSMLEHNRSEEMLEEAITANSENETQALRDEVLRTSARQLAESIATDMATERLRQLGQLLVSEIEGRLAGAVQQVMARGGELTETEKVLVQGVQDIATNATEILTQFIHQEEGVPEEGDNQGQEDADQGQVEVNPVEDELEDQVDEENEDEELSADDLEDEL